MPSQEKWINIEQQKPPNFGDFGLKAYETEGNVLEGDELGKENNQGKKIRIIKLFHLITILLLATGVYNEIYGKPSQKIGQETVYVGEKREPEQMTPEQVKKRAVEVLNQLYNLPEQAKNNPTLNKTLKERVARILIQRFALEIKKQNSGFVSPEDVRNALNILDNALKDFADFIGNKNGKPSPSEIEILQENPGIQTFFRMKAEYFHQ